MDEIRHQGKRDLGWVALWPPLDSILNERSAYRQTKLRYQQLQSEQIEITPSENNEDQSL